MATLIDCVQLALEESPRYEGAATTTPYRVSTTVSYLPAQNARILPVPSFVDRSDEMRGIEGGVPQLVDGFAPEGNVTIRCYLNSLVWFLQTLGLTDTITVGDGVITDPDAATIPVGAYRHVFTKRGGITAKTMQLICAYVDEGVFLKGQGFGSTNLTLNADGALGVDMLGLVVGRVADPNLTPVFDSSSIPHVRRGDLTLTWMAGSGTTEDFSLAIANALTARRSLSLATPSLFPDKMEHGDARVRLTGSIPKSILDPDDYDALVAGTTFTAKARWKTPVSIGATAYKYSIWIEMAKCQYTDGQQSPLSNARRFGMDTLNFWAAWDEAAGYDFKITVVNGITAAALETLV
jgi:hypothetical protein